MRTLREKVSASVGLTYGRSYGRSYDLPKVGKRGIPKIERVNFLPSLSLSLSLSLFRIIVKPF